MRRTLVLGLVLIAALGSGCQTAVGNYFGNRARDFGECFRLEAGLGVGIGAGVRGGGLGPLGFSMSNWHRGSTIGWVYGDTLPDSGPAAPTWSTEVNVLFMGVRQRSDTPALYLARGAPEARPEYWVADFGVPAIRGYTSRSGESVSSWIGSSAPLVPEGALPAPRWWSHARLHAFDVEAHAFAGFFGIRAGFSPGEFLDFLLGWVGLDIARDDSRWEPPRD